MPARVTSRAKAATVPLFEGYQPLGSAYDELFEGPNQPRPASNHVLKLLDSLGRDEFKMRRHLADSTFLRSGITFSVYSDNKGSERIFPFDLIPRIMGR